MEERVQDDVYYVNYIQNAVQMNQFVVYFDVLLLFTKSFNFPYRVNQGEGDNYVVYRKGQIYVWIVVKYEVKACYCKTECIEGVVYFI